MFAELNPGLNRQRREEVAQEIRALRTGRPTGREHRFAWTTRLARWVRTSPEALAARGA